MATTVPAAGSAKVLLRLPRDLHAHLRVTAEAQGVSVNTLMATLLAGASGWTLDLEHEQHAAMRGAPS
jgi:hypothetical protein